MAIQDVISELNRIQAAGLVEAYAIGGAIAAQVYIETSTTEDVDVFVVFTGESANSLAPLGPIWADLIAHGAAPEGEHLVVGGWPVQLLPPGTPLYDEAILDAQMNDFGGVQGRTMRPEYLAAIAIATGRNKDYVRVDEFIRRRKIDMAEFMKLIEKHGLQGKWKTFERRFLTPDA